MKNLLLTILVLPVLLFDVMVAQVQAIAAEDRPAVGGGATIDYEANAANCDSSLFTNGDLDGFLRALAEQESGGDPTILNFSWPRSTASGKYQYIISTWAARAQDYPPAQAYSEARFAPEEVQDALVYIEYVQKFEQFEGSIFDLAVSHFYPAALSNESLLDVVPPANVHTPREYAENLIERINNGAGADIPLRYNEAPEFQRWLGETGVDISLLSTSASAFTGCSGNSIAAGTQQAIVTVARAAIGSREDPDGSNCGDDLDEMFETAGSACGIPWCATFVRYVYSAAGLELGTTSDSSLAVGTWFEENQFFFSPDEPYQPEPGDIFVRTRGAEGSGLGHIGIVVEVNGFQIVTVEGNSGNQVASRTYPDFRTMSRIVGYGRHVDPNQVQPIPGYDPTANLPSEETDLNFSEE